MEEGTEPGVDREETLTREQRQRAEALQTASVVTSSTPSTLAQAVGGVRRGAPTILPGDLVRMAHWITTGESVIITDDETVVMRDDGGWTRISMRDLDEKVPSGDGYVFWAPIGATTDPPLPSGDPDEGKIDVPGYEQSAHPEEDRIVHVSRRATSLRVDDEDGRTYPYDDKAEDDDLD